MIYNSTSWAVRYVHSRTSSVENCWSYSVPRAVCCFSFFAAVTSKAWNPSETISFTYLANLEPDLAKYKELKNHFLCCAFQVFFLCSECLSFRLQGGNWLRHTLQNCLGFNWLLLGTFRAHLAGAESGVKAVVLGWKLCNDVYLRLGAVPDFSRFYFGRLAVGSYQHPLCQQHPLVGTSSSVLFNVSLLSGFLLQQRCDFAYSGPTTTKSTAGILGPLVGLAVQIYRVWVHYRLDFQNQSCRKLSGKNWDDQSERDVTALTDTTETRQLCCSCVQILHGILVEIYACGGCSCNTSCTKSRPCRNRV